MNKYNRIKFENRIEISCLLKQGLNYREIARELNFAVSTISEEIKKGKTKASWKMREGKDQRYFVFKVGYKHYVYNPHYANKKAIKRKSKSGAKVKLKTDKQLYLLVVKLLTQGKKPDVIAGILKKINGKTLICKETIYQFIYKNNANGLWQYLGVKRPKKRRKNRTKRKTYLNNKNRKKIHDRPDTANDRTEIGHFEADLIIGSTKGSKKVILTLTDRKSRMEFASFCNNKTADEVFNKTLLLAQTQIGINNIKSITYDNGSEFALYEAVEKQLNTDVYFADTYSSWQRGTNERHNGLLRRFFKKGRNFEDDTDADLSYAVNYWNEMERKILNYDCPNDIWDKETFP
jgi:IS30 family transposase